MEMELNLEAIGTIKIKNLHMVNHLKKNNMGQTSKVILVGPMDALPMKRK